MGGPGARCRVIGILNVTPDSFSDGGIDDSVAASIARGRALWEDGADLVDVGGESTRPGAVRPDADVESARVLPVLAGLAALGVPTSIDTMRARVARAAVEHGASYVNDVSGGLADPDMLSTVAALGVPYIAMHWRAHGATMATYAAYDDVVVDVCRELAARRDAALSAGIRPADLILDPGVGFAKNAEHNWALLAGLDSVAALGHPVLVGTSRKRFLGALLAVGGSDRPPLGRDDATTATTALAAAAGVWGVRVHDVSAASDAVRVVARWREAAR